MAWLLLLAVAAQAHAEPTQGVSAAAGAGPALLLQGFLPAIRPKGPLFSLDGRGRMLFSSLPQQVPAPSAPAAPRSGPATPLVPAEPARPGALLSGLSPGLASGLASPGQQCRQAIQAAEHAAGIPEHLMAAIGRIESGRRDTDGTVSPWPWSINVEGTDHIYDTKPEVIAAVAGFQSRGVRSIDVGCMQVNLMYHPDAFASLEQAFDPVANAAYAALFLTQLYKQTGSWEQATAWYHSGTPGVGDDYKRKVFAVLPDEQQRKPGAAGPLVAPLVPNIGGVAAGPSGGGGMLSNNAPAARIIPLAAGGAGRTLAEYRSAPILAVSRPLQRLPL